MLDRQLQELQLLKCSLIPGEHFSFIPPSADADSWHNLLEAYPDIAAATAPLSSARFEIKTDDSRIWFEAELPPNYGTDGGESATPVVSVKGQDITRGEQERWQTIIRDRLSELHEAGSEFPLYELISTHLLPRLHVETSSSSTTDASASAVSPADSRGAEPRYHALFTSHHLVSPTKRRNLQLWSGQLSVSGFAKVGHPGVIYCEGARAEVEEFVANVKNMQWLALRLRFIEPIPGDSLDISFEKRCWTEFEKVGEVVEEMRRIGRENFVVEMGIGSAGASTVTS